MMISNSFALSRTKLQIVLVDLCKEVLENYFLPVIYLLTTGTFIGFCSITGGFSGKNYICDGCCKVLDDLIIIGRT